MSLANYIKSADWKEEKHVPVITMGGQFASGQPIDIEVAVGKEVPHPNTVDHHIVWIALYYVAEGSQIPVELGRAVFSAHGSSATVPVAKFRITLDKPGTLLAAAYCNLHGLWESYQHFPPMGAATVNFAREISPCLRDKRSPCEPIGRELTRRRRALPRDRMTTT